MSLYQRLAAERDHELVHHGIKNQKWGDRKVPWYPIADYLSAKRRGTTDRVEPQKKQNKKTNKQDMSAYDSKTMNERGGSSDVTVESLIDNAERSKYGISVIKAEKFGIDITSYAWDYGDVSASAKSVKDLYDNLTEKDLKNVVKDAINEGTINEWNSKNERYDISKQLKITGINVDPETELVTYSLSDGGEIDKSGHYITFDGYYLYIDG